MLQLGNSRRHDKALDCIAVAPFFGGVMRKRKTSFLFAALSFGGSLFIANLALAAPPAPSPVYSWTGFYIGANFGVHSGQDNDQAYVSNNNDFIPSAVAAINAAAPVTLTATGPMGGLQAGYNWQFSSTVLGIEADVDALGGSGWRNTFGILNCTPCNPLFDSAQDRWMGTLRARFGYAFDRVLLFTTAGGAWSNWSTNHTFQYINAVSCTCGTDSSTPTRLGWTVGGGLEYAVSENWLMRVEYLYANFGTAMSTLVTVLPGSPGLITNLAEPEKLSENIVRAGLSYKFP